MPDGTDANGETGEELPRDVIDEAERLTRLAREAVDDGEAEAYRERRERLLSEYEFRARVREDDAGETLVLHPGEWVEDGSIHPERVEDTDRAVEVSLSGPGAPDEWAAVDEVNRRLVERVREEHGDVHGDNAAALADFAGNHYAKPMTELTDAELTEFLTDYYRRNVWPTEAQKKVVEGSIRYVFEVDDERVPEFSR